MCMKCCHAACSCGPQAPKPELHPHKHAALIKAWAYGAKIELWNGGEWRPTAGSGPVWDINTTYRIKPVPKPDIVLYGNIKETTGFVNPDSAVPLCGRFSIEKTKSDNMRVIYDGETNKLKSISMLD